MCFCNYLSCFQAIFLTKLQREKITRLFQNLWFWGKKKHFHLMLLGLWIKSAVVECRVTIGGTTTDKRAFPPSQMSDKLKPEELLFMTFCPPPTNDGQKNLCVLNTTHTHNNGATTASRSQSAWRRASAHAADWSAILLSCCCCCHFFFFAAFTSTTYMTIIICTSWKITYK